jgi:hypothetical protein
MQAASSMIVFSIDGKLNSSGNIDTNKSRATVQVKNGAEWETFDYSISPSNQTVSGAVTESGGVSLPSWGRGTWYDQISGLKVMVTETSITIIDTYGGEVIPMTIVEMESVGAAVRLLVRAKLIGDDINYTARFYVANTFDSTLSTAIGTTTLGTLTFNGSGVLNSVQLSAAVSGLPAGEKMFVAPYCSNVGSQIIASEYTTGGYSPMFNTTANARAATALRGIPTFTLAFMRSSP